MTALGDYEVSRQGYGAMGLSHSYGHADDAESIRTIQHAVDLGITLIDTANVYGDEHNEELVGKAIADRRGKIVFASKFGIVREGTDGDRRVNNEIAYMERELEGSLRRPNVERIDLYHIHRVDPIVPIEEIVGALAEQKQAGKLGAICLSEATADTLRRAAPTPRTRSRRCKANIRCGSGMSRPRSCRQPATSASASLPIVRLAAASSPIVKLSMTMIVVACIRDSSPTPLRPTRADARRSKPWRNGSARRRDR